MPSKRGPLAWGLALLLSLGCWGALFAGLLSSRSSVGLMFAGGWTLSLLPVHSARFRPLRPRPPRPPDAPKRGAVMREAAGRAWSDGIRRLRAGR